MKPEEQKFLQYYARASGLAIVKILIVYAGYAIGKWLEGIYPIHPWGILGGIFFGVVLGLSLVIYVAYKK